MINSMQQKEQNESKQREGKEENGLCVFQRSILNEITHRREQPEHYSNHFHQQSPLFDQIPISNSINSNDQRNSLHLESIFSFNNIEEQIGSHHQIMSEQQQNFPSKVIKEKGLKNISNTIFQILTSSGTISVEDLKRQLYEKYKKQKQSLNTESFKKKNNLNRRFYDSLAVLKSINLVEQYKKQVTLISDKNSSLELTELKKQLQEKERIMLQKIKKLQYYQQKLKICHDWQSQNIKNNQNDYISNHPKINFPSFPQIFIAYDKTNETQFSLDNSKTSSQISSIKLKSKDVQLISNLDAIKCLMNVRDENNKMEAEKKRQRQNYINQFIQFQ